MITKFYNKNVTIDYLRNITSYGKMGVSMLGLSDAAEMLGFKSLGSKLSFDQLIQDAPLPAILHWNKYHFVVLTPKSTKKKLTIADPAQGLITLTKEEFLDHWISTTENGEGKGTALLLETTPSFHKTSVEENLKSNLGLNYLLDIISKQKLSIAQLFFGLLLGSLLQLVFPYLTQSLVDTGIQLQDLSFVQIILAAQLMLLFSQTMIDFIRSRILLHISTRLNISLLSAFWVKLLKLPFQFFESKHPGDIMQRIQDHHRIENFLTGTAINTFFSLFSLVIFSIVLLSYNTPIFFIFMGGSLLYFIWIKLFLRWRRNLDYKRFSIAGKENNATMQLVYGMQEIKLYNAENTFRWTWEGLQAGLFKLNFKSLSLNQTQQFGAFFINQGKNILITFVVAKLVLEGQLTVGMMLAVQYIIGQLNSPIEQLIGFVQQAQDAKISIERLNDIHSLDNEEKENKEYLHSLPTDKNINIKNLSFTYPGAGNEQVLTNINLSIPAGKITAIVGSSGSGKTTLVKLLLRFYENYKGDISIGSTNFKNISPRYWRSLSGAVMQDSYLFNSTIQKNITVSDDRVDTERLDHACRTANIHDFIESLPLGFYTPLGAEGQSISGGQRQRISIARAVYKNPDFIFLDEATNSLDATNESIILENLDQFYKGKTVVIIAHRLSTVKNADKIVVLEHGEIKEEGNHVTLTAQKGRYYELVKNQLELGNS
jgi:ATP-binding cassette subfamily B protein